jgi:hypothetical protein
MTSENGLANSDEPASRRSLIAISESLPPDPLGKPNEPAIYVNPGAYPRAGMAPVSFRGYYYPAVEDDQWNDWRWQFRNRVTTLAELERFFPLSADERAALAEILHEFRLGITPYYLSLIDPTIRLTPCGFRRCRRWPSCSTGKATRKIRSVRIDSRPCPASCIVTPTAAC